MISNPKSAPGSLHVVSQLIGLKFAHLAGRGERVVEVMNVLK